MDEMMVRSREDEEFFLKAATKARQRPDGMIEIPLPFKSDEAKFVSNRNMAFQRTRSTLVNLRKSNPEMLRSSLDKFDKNLKTSTPRFVQVSRKDSQAHTRRAYWIPLFSVWQKEKSRIVFDAKAPTKDVCLNDTLLQGPDRNNSLRGVLMRFRSHPYAVTADIKNMFHNIAVPDDQYMYLRFFSTKITTRINQ